jgi:hypothetical protein
MKILLIVFSVVYCSLNLLGQQNPFDPVQSKWEVISNNVELNYYNSDYCDYYLVSSRNKELRIVEGKNNLIRRPQEKYNRYDSENLPSSFRVYKGYFPDKINPEFLYSLPIRNGDSTQYMINTKKRTLTYLFQIVRFDTVYAVRSGVICKNEDQGLFNSEEALEIPGSILIYHLDRTFAQYGLLSKVFVKSGEKVKVGEPIGLASAKRYISMSFFYLDKNKFQGGSTLGVPHTHFNPFFHSKYCNVRLEEGKIYINEWSDDVITQEMSKNEKKRYEKNKLKLLDNK